MFICQVLTKMLDNQFIVCICAGDAMIYKTPYWIAVLTIIFSTSVYGMELPFGYLTPQKKTPQRSDKISYDSLDSDDSTSSRLTPNRKRKIAGSLVDTLLRDRTNQQPTDAESDSHVSDEEDTNEENDSQKENRIPQLERTFTRDYPRLENQVESAAASPARQAAIIEEAQRLDPFLRAMYLSGYEPGNPLDPTPVKTTIKHTRSRMRKLSAHEVRNIANTHLSTDRWSAIIAQIMGYGPIHQNDDLINPLRVVDRELNLERMLRGEAPLGPDNHPVNLHHVIQGVDEGHVAEISASAHRRETAVLHRGAAGIHNRYAFNTFRMEYWQARAYDFIESFGLNAY